MPVKELSIKYYKDLMRQIVAENLPRNSTWEDEKEAEKIARQTVLGIYKADLRLKKELDEIYKQECGDPDKISGWFFLTIRPPDEVEFKQLFNLAKTITSLGWIKTFHLVFEQKGETLEEMGKGKHIHCLLEVTTPKKGKQFWISEIHRTFGKVKLNDILKRENIDLKPVCDKGSYDTRINYINTETFLKTDDWKEAAWKLDAPWRKMMKLKDTYTNVKDFEPQIQDIKKLLVATPPPQVQ